MKRLVSVRRLRKAGTVVGAVAAAVVTSPGVAHAAPEDHRCSATSSASTTDPGGRDAVANSRDGKDTTKFFRLEFQAHGEIVRASNTTNMSVHYYIYFENKDYSWNWFLPNGRYAITDNLDLPENINLAIQATPNVSSLTCQTNGGRT
ncbi:hypothetical protein [Streptomyces koyangensis]